MLRHKKSARTKIKVEKVVLLTSYSLLLWMLLGKINTLFSQKNQFFQNHIAFSLVFQICILWLSLLSKCWSLNFSKCKWNIIKLNFTYINSKISKKKPSKIVRADISKNFEITLSRFICYPLSFSLFFLFKCHFNHLQHSIILRKISLAINIVHNFLFLIFKNLIGKL